MRRRNHIRNLLIGLLTVILVAGAFTSFQRKRSSFERLDFHWIWQEGVIHVDRVDPGSGAEISGLQVGDQIWVVGGVSSHELDGLKAALLGGELSQGQLDNLARTVREQRSATDDPKLEAVLDEIETRAAVELAKLEAASRVG